MPVEVDDLIHM